MTLSIREISPYLGAEIIGFDPKAAVSDETWRQLTRAFDKHYVLVFRDMDLDPIMQHRICDVLQAGDPEAARMPETDKFSYVSNREKEGGSPYGRLLFHCDMMWSDLANQTASLFAVEAEQPPTPTTFVSSTYAWKTLPDELKERVKGLKARHESGQQGRGDTKFENELIQPNWNKLNDTIAPVANPHPRTGEIMLYVCEQQTREIVGLSKAESDALLDQLFAHLYQEERIVPHHWRKGDLVAWDNQALQHGRPYVQGDGPARTLRKIHAPRDIMKRYGAGPTYAAAMA